MRQVLDFEGLDKVGWTGDWPPPERIGYVVGKETGLASFVHEQSLAEAEVTIEDVERVGTITWFRRDSYSKLPETDHPHVARAARYVRE